MTHLCTEMLKSEEGRRLYRDNVLYHRIYETLYWTKSGSERVVVVQALQSACRELDELKAEKANAWARAPIIIVRENTNA